MTDLFNYHRRDSSEVRVGDTPLGGNPPIRVQSMATVSTNDTEGAAEQAIEKDSEFCVMWRFLKFKII